MPSIFTDAIEIAPEVSGTHVIPPDGSTPNPNSVEIDNFYVVVDDMFLFFLSLISGMVFFCSSLEDACDSILEPPVQTEQDLIDIVLRFIDRLMLIARPRTVLYFAMSFCFCHFFLIYLSFRWGSSPSTSTSETSKAFSECRTTRIGI
jgi:hypothetical protein